MERSTAAIRGTKDLLGAERVSAPPGSFAEQLLELAAHSSALMKNSLRAYGDAPLADVLGSLGTPDTRAFQGRDDLWAVIGAQTEEYYGAEVARDAVAELRSDPMIPTSNHFGIDTFADSVQGTLLYALRPRPGGGRRRTVVVLGCGSVSLDNLTYPMGLLLYDPGDGDVAGVPRRLPVFTNRFRRWTVGSVRPFDEQMVRRAHDRLHKMRLAGQITPFSARAAGEILDADLAVRDTLALPTYGHQAARINASLWRRMLARTGLPTRLVQLELEAVCAALLAKDLYDPASLVHRLLFAPAVREALLAGLDGARACWRREKLRRRLDDPTDDAQSRDGTIFFWGLTEDGRRVPLTVVPEKGTTAGRLAGIDERRRRWEWEFSADAIAAGLRDGRLIPSLLTCFAVLTFARGVVAVGGYYQAEYLAGMQRGIVAALRTEDEQVARRVAEVPTGVCLAGMQFAMRLLADGRGIPAGPVEIAGVGGLAEQDLARIESVTLREAYLAAFPELFHHVAPDARLPADWVARLTAENGAGCPNLLRLHAQDG